MNEEILTQNEGESNLNFALRTPVEQLTDEQKALIQNSVEALSEEEKARYVEAGIIEAAPESDGGEAPEDGEGDGEAAAE